MGSKDRKSRWLAVGAGVVANIAVGRLNRWIERLESESRKRRERELREGSPHDRAGVVLGEKILRRPLTEREQRMARLAFSAAYGAAWGLVYAAARRRLRLSSLAMGLPFGLAFYGVCDGLMAPALHLTPPPRQLPWQPNVREALNHVVWTATAEGVHRLAA